MKQVLEDFWEFLWVAAFATVIGALYFSHSVFQHADNFREVLSLIDPLFVLGGLIFIAAVFTAFCALFATLQGLILTCIYGPIYGPERQFISNESEEERKERQKGQGPEMKRHRVLNYYWHPRFHI